MQLSKTLSALALLGAVIPAAHALSIKDDTVKLGVGIRLQTRATVADATGTDGQEYRVQSGTLDAVNDPLDFSVPRARLYLKIGYGENWKGELAFNADNIDNTGSNTNRALAVRYAWAQRIFKLEGEGMSHAIAFGLMKPLANAAADASMSSSRALFPTDSATRVLASYREMGIEWTFNHPMFLIAVDLFQNEDGSKDVSTPESRDEAEGFLLGGRVEFSFSPEWFISKRAESFLGKEGRGLNFGISAISNQDDVDATATQTTTGIGVDIMAWWNSLSAFAEFRTQTVDTDAFAGGTTDVTSEAIVVQAGWAIPLENGCVVEPALRINLIDNDTDNDSETPNYGSGELGGSGTQIDIGINYYLDGHNNKLQLAYQMWEAEEGEADASIIRLQHQLNF